MYTFQYTESQHRAIITKDKFGVTLEAIGPRTAEFLKELVSAANHEGKVLLDLIDVGKAEFHYIGDPDDDVMIDP